MTFFKVEALQKSKWRSLQHTASRQGHALRRMAQPHVGPRLWRLAVEPRRGARVQVQRAAGGAVGGHLRLVPDGLRHFAWDELWDKLGEKHPNLFGDLKRCPTLEVNPTFCGIFMFGCALLELLPCCSSVPSCLVPRALRAALPPKDNLAGRFYPFQLFTCSICGSAAELETLLNKIEHQNMGISGSDLHGFPWNFHWFCMNMPSHRVPSSAANPHPARPRLRDGRRPPLRCTLR